MKSGEKFHMEQFKNIQFDETEMKYAAAVYFSRSLRNDLAIISDDYLQSDPQFTYYVSNLAAMKLEELERKAVALQIEFQKKLACNMGPFTFMSIFIP